MDGDWERNGDGRHRKRDYETGGRREREREGGGGGGGGGKKERERERERESVCRWSRCRTGYGCREESGADSVVEWDEMVAMAARPAPLTHMAWSEIIGMRRVQRSTQITQRMKEQRYRLTISVSVFLSERGGLWEGVKAGRLRVDFSLLALYEKKYKREIVCLSNDACAPERLSPTLKSRYQPISAHHCSQIVVASRQRLQGRSRKTSHKAAENPKQLVGSCQASPAAFRRRINRLSWCYVTG